MRLLSSARDVRKVRKVVTRLIAEDLLHFKSTNLQIVVNWPTAILAK